MSGIPITSVETLLLSNIKKQILSSITKFNRKMRIDPDFMVINPAAMVALNAQLNPRDYMLGNLSHDNPKTVFNMVVYISQDVKTFRVGYAGDL